MNTWIAILLFSILGLILTLMIPSNVTLIKGGTAFLFGMGIGMSGFILMFSPSATL